MFQSIPVFEKNIFAYKVVGQLTKLDYEEFLSELSTLIRRYGKISILIDLEDFDGLDAKAAWEDFKFSTEHDEDFEKIAIIGDNQWQLWMTILRSAFMQTNICYFERFDASDAWDWLREDDEDSKTNSDESLNTIQPYQRILAATDFSLHSEKALRRAHEIAKTYYASLSVIYVLTYHQNYDSNYLILAEPGQFDEADQILFDNSEKKLTHLTERLGMENIHQEVLWGTPKATILSYAKAQKVDLIVMGSHGRSGLARLIGSTTNGVINHAECEVLSINLGKD